jgi:hypothetical protein
LVISGLLAPSSAALDDTTERAGDLVTAFAARAVNEDRSSLKSGTGGRDDWTARRSFAERLSMSSSSREGETADRISILARPSAATGAVRYGDRVASRVHALL